MAAYGYFTKRDLSSIGKILFMALIGLIYRHSGGHLPQK